VAQEAAAQEAEHEDDERAAEQGQERREAREVDVRRLDLGLLDREHERGSWRLASGLVARHDLRGLLGHGALRDFLRHGALRDLLRDGGAPGRARDAGGSGSAPVGTGAAAAAGAGGFAASRAGLMVASVPRSERVERALRVQREAEDDQHERDEDEPVGEADVARLDRGARPVVHRPDEGAQHVDAGHDDAVKAMIAIAIFASKTPSRMRNSPTKLREPGIASVASATIEEQRASTGARNAMPPMSRMSCDPPARAASSATMKNAGATTSRG
jgi:hypothetical protein